MRPGGGYQQLNGPVITCSTASATAPAAWRCRRRCGALLSPDFGSGGTLAAIHRRTPSPPHLLAGRFPQKKIFQNELPIAGRKRFAANPARYFTVNARLRSGFGFDDLIKRVAMWALKMDCRGSDHDMSPARTYPMLSIFRRQRQLIR
jgi:hypothetical protein